jgi:hypothetical protein
LIIKRRTGHSHRREHVIYASLQVNAVIVALAVGKIDEVHNLNLDTRAGEDLPTT